MISLLCIKTNTISIKYNESKTLQEIAVFFIMNKFSHINDMNNKNERRGV